jgi:phospholipid/cholesterol/gamma-HCH transport system substrate-binding protein
MRRLACLVALAAMAAAVLLGLGAGAPGTEMYRVDAVFQNAAFLIPGQDVKIAGARVGSVKDVSLTPDRRARVQMEIEPGFAPFRSDAECIIRPQSLIGEKFVQCSPGTQRGRGLRGDPPTVRRTFSPIDLDLVFAALRRPFRERLAIAVNELGAGLAGRPRELSAAVRRANPALQEAQDLLAILDEDRDTLGRLVERSDQVLEEVGSRRSRVQSFIENADSTAQALASRRGELDQAVRRLPPLLDELEPSAERLAALTRDATPVVRDLRSAAPWLRSLFADLDPLTQAARPALRELAGMADTGRRALGSAGPVARKLRPLARRLPPLTELAADLTVSLRERGVVEGLERFVYFASAATARFDRHSHIVPSYLIAGPCQEYRAQPLEGCSARWEGAPAGPASRRRAPKLAPGERTSLDYLLEP